jgi:excisionase family DNA binding protein
VVGRLLELFRREAFLFLTNAALRHYKMKTYSVSESARLLDVDRRTLQRWVSRKKIPAPTALIVKGRLEKSWTEEQMRELRDYRRAHYAGKGLNRRTGKKAKRTKPIKQ